MATDDDALIRDLYEAFGAGDYARLAQHLSPDVEFHNPDYALEPGVRYGADELIGVIERLHETFEFRAVEPRRWERIGDRIAVAYQAQLRARGSGAPLDTGFGHVWTVREDGTVLRLDWFRTYEEAQAAARAQERDVAMLKRLYEAWQAGDHESALAAIGSDTEWVEPSDTPDGQTWRGREGVLASMAEWTEPFDDYGFDIIEASGVGRRVLVGLVQRGRGKGSGVEVESEVWHLWTLREGRAVRLQMFRSRSDAVAAAAEGSSCPSGAA